MSLRWKQYFVTFALVLSLACSFERSAFAYVDPGSSLLAYQSFSAVITGALFYFRHRLKSLFRRSTDVADTSAEKTR